MELACLWSLSARGNWRRGCSNPSYGLRGENIQSTGSSPAGLGGGSSSSSFRPLSAVLGVLVRRLCALCLCVCEVDVAQLQALAARARAALAVLQSGCRASAECRVASLPSSAIPPDAKPRQAGPGPQGEVLDRKKIEL